MSVKILLNGAKGRMGQAIIRVAPEFGCEVVAALDQGDDPAAHIDSVDMVVDFSFHSVTPALAELAAKKGKSIVIGTTGHSAEEKARIIECSKAVPMVFAGNYSLGVNLLYYLVSRAAQILGPEFNPEVVEMHHCLKKDAPSGTAERIVEVIRDARKLGPESVTNGREGLVGERPMNEIGVHALRGGDVVGDHTVIFAGPGERVEISHKAGDRSILARGAMRAAAWLNGKKPGLYEMKDVLGLE
ncbi:MAG: 4-hydroxy-tetrahydrodipicolinate reductase [Opitutales bacterium]|nr:4-hydroxy-tetrahydrodipicolinate reductase [Opitutales bacterium]